MYRRPVIGLAFLWIAIATPASAQIIAFWQQVTVTPQAIANDPQLASMQCWDLMVTTTGNWASAKMRADLPSGMFFYKHPLAGLTRPDPAAFGSSPALEFTTYVSAPSDNGANHTTAVLGAHPQGLITPSLGDPTSAYPGTFSIYWGDPVPTPPSSYQIARLTFPLQVLPDVYNPPLGDYSATAQVNPLADIIIPDIPESSMSCLVVGGSTFLFRARRSRSQRMPLRHRCHRALLILNQP